MKLELFVRDISCGHCKMRIEKRVSVLPGVRKVEVDVARKMVSVEGEVDTELVKRAIAELGYSV
ncbi:MAG: heavy-metal-associated domain-containing protein [candidate division KSB1 bacterium]|nr:heavy-metal-associated domain-containing protein [candidate division KSB1 bacterium]MDZ7294847.1 heavy-metal-associated domain-containing protein [candidate division KSB1 bacterium]MDZ7386274.1 heavy-metal-associated domain-containing protein [candidate division KSB1 bacterium]MDZ7392016.1 heavy-metal-associated domain-containing protein [candidate division KSB1 bacterium]MDZ7412815.1 heavy-metal-associated domain-containing protein [candidate division KSB1 bacterium]